LKIALATQYQKNSFNTTGLDVYYNRHWEGDHWGDQGVDGWIILGGISRMWDVGIWTGVGWPRIETGGGCL